MAAHPIGAGNARDAVEFAAELELGSDLANVVDIVDDHATVAERLAELDYLLTGTACYALTWPDRLDRIRQLQRSARAAGDLFGPLDVRTGEQRG